MPDRNGLELLNDIKLNHPETEVIFLTGHGSTSDGVSGIKAGAFDYLNKPVELDHLLKKIKQAHEKKIRDEEKKKEAESRSAMEKQLLAAERLAALGVIASGVAHEINNPLAIIQGWSELMQSLLQESDADFPLREEFEKGFEKIDLAISRAKQITHKMLGTLQLRTEQFLDVKPSDLLESAVNLIMKEASNKQLSIDLLPGNNHISLRADPYAVQHVLLNI
jgi:C4-dicarboxylate-specific signal transduction histidine kinase